MHSLTFAIDLCYIILYILIHLIYLIHNIGNSLSFDPFGFLTVPSPVGGPPRMTRSNSIPTHDASMELYGASPLGSTLSLAERPRSMGMVRSGSFRDKEPDEGEPPKSYRYPSNNLILFLILLCSVLMCNSVFGRDSDWFTLFLLILFFQFMDLYSPWHLMHHQATLR